MNASSLPILAVLLAAAPLLRADAPAGPPDPLDLKGAIVYALDHNYAILQARESVRQEQGVVVQVQAAGLPNLSASGNYQRNSATAQPGPFQPTTEWTAQVRVSQTLFAGGGIRASVRGARLTREAALADLQAAIDAALLDVRTRFYAVLLAREKVRVEEENVRLFEGELGDTQNQFKAGSVSNFEVLRARVSLANAQPDLITARNDYRIAIEQLRQALGVPPSRGPKAPAFPQLQGSLAVAAQDFDLDAALASAHAHRPELLRLDLLSRAGEEQIRSARAGYYPSVGVFGAYEWDGVDIPPQTLFPSPATTYNGHGWLGGVQGSWPIFDGRATAGRVIQAKSQLREAQLSEAQEDLAVEIDVRQAFSSWEEAKELMSASQKTVQQAEEALRLANNRFKAGSATQLDVLTSQVALTQARTNAIQANYTYLVAVATLRKAMGLSDAPVRE